MEMAASIVFTFTLDLSNRPVNGVPGKTPDSCREGWVPVDALGHALSVAGSMTWEVTWALIFGFALSAEGHLELHDLAQHRFPAAGRDSARTVLAHRRPGHAADDEWLTRSRRTGARSRLWGTDPVGQARSGRIQSGPL